MNTVAFLYRWTHVPTGKWYEGSRTAKGCHPDDGYVCSSKTVKPMILENKSEWKREILVIGDAVYIAELEAARLANIDAKNDPMSFNLHNGDGKFVMTGKIGGRKGKSPWNKGLSADVDSRIHRLGKNVQGVSGDKNGMFGKEPWNKGLDKSDPRVQQYSTKVSISRKGKCVGEDNPAKKVEVREVLSEQKHGIKNPSWKGYYVDGQGNIFATTYEAAAAHTVSATTISRWTESNRNGWKFIPKELVAPEIKRGKTKGEF
jgi:hypothetical protein